ncbi:hypothetical protein AQPE_0879 [Aquipluma nitroreducens]|uniref:Uncharacterized protein n=1 Tax=Aquipluma nitroreducens TaxID=2010828 RepID=A0A5K7S5D0_9BACT|nr:hypothetical protein AQPE_0879 [Aquipluma nitroreducens]
MPKKASTPVLPEMLALYFEEITLATTPKYSQRGIRNA